VNLTVKAGQACRRRRERARATATGRRTQQREATRRTDTPERRGVGALCVSFTSHPSPFPAAAGQAARVAGAEVEHASMVRAQLA
jgi:hypothetical protein